MCDDVIHLNIEHARRCLVSADILLKDGDYAGAVNRLYYCVFHSVRALLSNDSVEFKKHSTVIAYFREKYVKTGIFEKRLSEIIGDLFDERNGSDYNDLYFINCEGVEQKINDACYFLNKICDYLASPQ
ncbi:hypothetical protein R80B4_00412 [Fibrobacteres bacterium R8-0-B4]